MFVFKVIIAAGFTALVYFIRQYFSLKRSVRAMLFHTNDGGDITPEIIKSNVNKIVRFNALLKCNYLSVHKMATLADVVENVSSLKVNKLTKKQIQNVLDTLHNDIEKDKDDIISIITTFESIKGETDVNEN